MTHFFFFFFFAKATVGVIIGQIIRRTQLIEKGHPDPFPISGWSYTDSGSPSDSINRFVVKELEEADHLNAKNNALLRLILLLEQGKSACALYLLYIYSY